MATLTVTARGQVTFRKEVLQHLGIRPGEKLHECMIAEEDSPYTLEFEQFYLIKPMIRNWIWNSKRHCEGKPVPEGFRFCSDRNDRWLNKEQLLQVLSKYKLVGGEMAALDEFETAEL